MRSKLFFAFILVILTALVSNVIYRKLIIADFDEFLQGSDEDRIYWVMASVESCYEHDKWNMRNLLDALHWAVMLGFETYVENVDGKKILSSTKIFSSLHTTMNKRMHSMFELPYGFGKFIWFPLFVEGQEIGRLYVRPLKRRGFIPAKEEIFRKRVQQFLVTSFLISGGGALVLAVLFSLYLTYPLRTLSKQAENVSKGDYTFKPPKNKQSKDELSRLTNIFGYMVEALNRQDTLRRHLTSNITHELRTPLSIIKGNLEAIEDGIILDPQTALNNITVEINRIIGLIEGIEDITRAEASFFKKGEPVIVDLKEFIEAQVTSILGLAKKKSIDTKTMGPNIKVLTYPDKLDIVLKNLLSNALKYTNSGHIEITWNKLPNKGFLISVHDTGIGIQLANKNDVFERFYKGAHSNGKGLGLSIAKELVQVMGGKIEVENYVDKGSTFTVKFYD